MTDDSPLLRPDLIARTADALARASHVCVLTGAGISAESGIPTFRDALTGLWERFRPEELATPKRSSATRSSSGSGTSGGAT